MNLYIFHISPFASIDSFDLVLPSMKQKRHNIKRYSFIQLYLIFKDIFWGCQKHRKGRKIISRDLLDHVHDLLALVEPQVMVGDRHPLEGDSFGILEEGVWSPNLLCHQRSQCEPSASSRGNEAKHRAELRLAAGIHQDTKLSKCQGMPSFSDCSKCISNHWHWFLKYSPKRTLFWVFFLLQIL